MPAGPGTQAGLGRGAPLRAAAPRRTVQITGRMDAPAFDPTRPRRPRTARAAGRPAAATPLIGRPDRIAMWAVVLGFFLLAVAAISSADADAATRLGDRTLKAGMVGRDVRHLQLRLKHAGVLQAPATARFGALTKRAVRRYQRSRCLHADGIAGPATIRALRARRRACRGRSRAHSGARRTRTRTRTRRAAYVRVQLGRRTLARGMAGRDVRTLQRLLGLPAAGRYGPVTTRAVSASSGAPASASTARSGPPRATPSCASACAPAPSRTSAPASTAAERHAGRSSPARSRRRASHPAVRHARDALPCRAFRHGAGRRPWSLHQGHHVRPHRRDRPRAGARERPERIRATY